jgi:hypothetical protein
MFLYHKSSGRIQEKSTTKSLFSEKDLNSIVLEDGTIDHGTVEINLNQNFETDFKEHYDIIMDTLNTVQTKQPLNILNSVKYLMRIGLIGEMRTPKDQKERHEYIMGAFKQVTDGASEEIKKSLEVHEQMVSVVKSKSPVDFDKVVDGVIELMGDIMYAILLAPKGEYFLLPDCTSISLRENLLKDIVINGEICTSGGSSIASITFPINSKVALFCMSTKVREKKPNVVIQLTEDNVQEYNVAFFKASDKGVVCESKEFLEKFVANYKLSSNNFSS